MHIIVCIKQVPASNDVKINSETNTIIREGMEGEINPFDLYAVENALKIKDKLGGKVTVLSMGISAVSALLKKAIAMGADEGILLTDPLFAGSDTLATAYILSMGIKKIGNFDLIICGKQAIDGDTAQVGPSVAAKLTIPHTTNVRVIEEINPDNLLCKRIIDSGYEMVTLPFPSLVTVGKGSGEPRIASMKGIFKARKTNITQWSCSDIGADKQLCGLDGSPTQVVKIFAPDFKSDNQIFEGKPEEKAKKLIDTLRSKQLLSNF